MYPTRSGGSPGVGNALRSAPASGSRDDGPSLVAVISRVVSPYILTLVIRPMPDQASAPRRALPGSRNRPGRESRSTARLTIPTISGTSCHSSRSTGSGIAASAALASKRKAAGCLCGDVQTHDGASEAPRAGGLADRARPHHQRRRQLGEQLSERPVDRSGRIAGGIHPSTLACSRGLRYHPCPRLSSASARYALAILTRRRFWPSAGPHLPPAIRA